MKRLLLSAALFGALSGQSVWAQDTTATPAPITAPEGYTLNSAPLTADELMKATIYDSTGATVGEISDLIFEQGMAGATTSTGDAGASTSTGDTGTATTQTDTTQSGTASAGAAADMSKGKITHVVLDVGGFLGMGEHRVALPASDLSIYGNGSDVRVYLPWTKDQLKALPTYDANDPSTLGKSQMPASN